MSVNEAEARLLLDRHRAARPLLKLLRSAVNGASKKEMNLETLFVSEVRVDQGSMLKRFMPRAQGRSVMIQKKMSHIILGLGENPHQGGARFTMPEKRVKKEESEPKAQKPRKTSKKPEGEPKAKKDDGAGRRFFGRKSPSSEG
jgi:hypothetical protein